MIRVLAYHGEDMDQQLAEIQIERTATPPYNGVQEYTAQVVVDNIEEVHAFSITFGHHRESENILGLIDALMEQIDADDHDKFLLEGKLDDRKQWHENLKDIILELRGR